MSSISATVGQYAASNPVVGMAVNNASASSALLGSLSGGTVSGPFDNVISALAAAPANIANSIASISNPTSTAATGTASATTWSATNGSAALQQASNQGSIASQLLAFTGLGQNVDTVA